MKKGGGEEDCQVEWMDDVEVGCDYKIGSSSWWGLGSRERSFSRLSELSSSVTLLPSISSH